MKLTMRIFALLVVVVGAAAAANTPKAAPVISSHQSATEKMPAPPMCGPNAPWPDCPTQPDPQ